MHACMHPCTRIPRKFSSKLNGPVFRRLMNLEISGIPIEEVAAAMYINYIWIKLLIELGWEEEAGVKTDGEKRLISSAVIVDY